MNTRTIVISILVHVVLGAVVVALDGKPKERIATVVRIMDGTPEPEPEPEPEPAPEPEPEPEKAEPAKAEPKKAPKPRKARRARRAAQPAPAAEAEASGGSARGDVFVSGLVLGNADGPGMAVRVSGDSVGAGPTTLRGVPAAPKPKAIAVSPQKKRRSTAKACRDKVRPKPLGGRATIPYPEVARSAGAQGRLVLRLHVGKDGSVDRVTVVNGVHDSIDAEAIRIARTWRFRPAQHCGREVADTYVIARRFELTD